MSIVSISGSPSAPSRSATLLQLAEHRLARAGWPQARPLPLRTLSAQALLQADTRQAEVAAALDAVRQAQLVLIATPIYKAAYSGLLKAFLDLLPQDGLQGKTVLTLATGGSPAHLLALDYALKPVLWALGARHFLDGVFATDAQFRKRPDGSYLPDEAVSERLDRSLQGLGGAGLLRAAPFAPQRTAGPALCSA